MKEIINTGEKVRRFYNKTPFPDYDLSRFNTKNDLKFGMWEFSKILDRSIPENASIVDCGTGTGQLSAFLSLRRKKVVGFDFSDASLNKAKALKKKLKLNSWHLEKVDLMDTRQINKIIRKYGKFDYVLSLGVLHHTKNPRVAFRNIMMLLKPEGYTAIGLYNKYARIPLKIRKILAKTIFKNNQKVKDWFIKMQLPDFELDKERARGWWNDQYEHPHELSISVGEVLSWFKENNIEYYQTQPPMELFYSDKIEITGVWQKHFYPYLPLRMLRQLQWIITTNKEGGYWITFGRKKRSNLSH